MKLFYAFICLLIGGLLAHKVKRRQFNRTNQYGKEEFGSYGDKIITTSVDKLMWGAALALIALGALLVL